MNRDDRWALDAPPVVAVAVALALAEGVRAAKAAALDAALVGREMVDVVVLLFPKTLASPPRGRLTKSSNTSLETMQQLMTPAQHWRTKKEGKRGRGGCA